MSKIVILGFGSAGYAALMSIRRQNSKHEIVVIDNKDYDLLHPCGLPYSLEGMVEEEGLSQNIGLDKMRVTKIKGTAQRISQDKKIIVETQEGQQEIDFDKAIITTGNKVKIPPIDGLKEYIGKGIFTLTGIEDLRNIKSMAQSGSTACVIGAGAIGLEAAVALKELGMDVTVIEGMNEVLPGVLDSDMTGTVEQYLTSHNIKCNLGSFIKSLSKDGSTFTLQSEDKHFTADLCVLATGFGPDLSIAENSKIEYNQNGIVVNEKLETSMDSVYGAGDCIDTWSVIDNKEIAAKLATSAYKQGTAAGINCAGGDFSYKGSAGTFVTKIGHLEVAGTGFNTEEAKKRGYKTATGKINTHILPDYFPDNNQIVVKIIFDSETGKIIGAQAIGKKGAAERVNIISTAIEFSIKIDELQRLEMAYCPAVSEVYDPLMRAVDFGLRRMKKK